MKAPDIPRHRKPWGRFVWIVPVVLWLALSAGSADRSTAAPAAPLAAPAILADVLRPSIYFASAPRIHITRHFEFVNNRSPEWSTQLGDVLEDLYSVFARDMKLIGFNLSEPTEPLIWVCFDDEKAFNEYARTADSFRPSWLREYYSPRTNRVAMFSKASIMQATSANTTEEPADILPISHEAAHQFSYSTGLFKRGVMYPVWLTEGVAMSFETNTTARMGLNKLNEPRLRQLLAARREGRMLPLGELLVMTHFRPDEGHEVCDLYAQADGFFTFMLVTRTSEMRGFIERTGAMQPGRRSKAALKAEFIAAFGPIADIEAAWNSHLDTIDRALMIEQKKSPAKPSPAFAGLVTPVVNR